MTCSNNQSTYLNKLAFIKPSVGLSVYPGALWNMGCCQLHIPTCKFLFSNHLFSVMSSSARYPLPALNVGSCSGFNSQLCSLGPLIHTPWMLTLKAYVLPRAFPWAPDLSSWRATNYHQVLQILHTLNSPLFPYICFLLHPSKMSLLHFTSLLCFLFSYPLIQNPE